MRSPTCAAIDDVRPRRPEGECRFAAPDCPPRAVAGEEERARRPGSGLYVIVYGARGGCAGAPPPGSSSSMAAISKSVENGFARTFAAPMSFAMWR